VCLVVLDFHQAEKKDFREKLSFFFWNFFFRFSKVVFVKKAVFKVFFC